MQHLMALVLFLLFLLDGGRAFRIALENGRVTRLQSSHSASLSATQRIHQRVWSSSSSSTSHSSTSNRIGSRISGHRRSSTSLSATVLTVLAAAATKTTNAVARTSSAAAAAASSSISSIRSSSSSQSLLAQLSRFLLLLPSLLSSLTIGPSIVGGLLSGGLHAITGPDHLAAILPPSVGQPGLTGLRIGATWGLGHGISAVFLGLCAFFLKGRVSEQFKFLERMSTLAEAAVGMSLMLIGAIGIKENLHSVNTDGHGDGINAEPPVAPLKSSQAIFANGVLHGFSWDGAPSLAPALAMTSYRGALSFLLSYCLGTMLAMSLTAGLVGEGSVRLGKVVNSPNLPRQLSLGSSVIAILIGAYWVVTALL